MSSVLEYTLPTGWKEDRLENIIAIGSSITYGVVQPGPEDEQGVPFVRGGDIYNGKIAVDKLRTISQDVSKTYKRTLLEGGELLMSLVGYPGEVAIVPSELVGANIARQAAYIKLDEKNDNKYLMYYLLSEIGKFFLFQKSTGSAQQVINLVELKEVNIILPLLAQQQKIAKILSTVDNLIEKTQTLIEKYTAIKQGMMADLFTRGIDMTAGGTPNSKGGKLRPSVEDAPELYKQTELGWVPKAWEVKPLGEYLSMITYGFTNPMPEAEDGPWMVTAANVVHGGIDYKKTRKTTLEAFNTLLTQKSRPKLNDILLTKDGTLGRLAIVDNENLCINQSVALLRCNESAKPEFLKLLLETERYYQKMLDDAGGSTIKHIYITIVNKMLLAMPISENEQEAIFTRANAINEKIEFEKRNSEKYKKLKKGLMQDLLTGKVKVQ